MEMRRLGRPQGGLGTQMRGHRWSLLLVCGLLAGALAAVQAQRCPEASGSEAKALVEESAKLGADLLKLSTGLAHLREENRRKQFPAGVDIPELPAKTFWMEDDAPSMWEQRKLRPHGAYNFIAYSAYRLSPQVITVVGLGRSYIHNLRKPGGCRWLPEGGGEPVSGELKLHYAPEKGWRPNELVLLECTFAEPTSTVSRDGNVLASSVGGALEVKLDAEVLYPYRERQGFQVHEHTSEGPFPYSLLFCSPPMYGNQSLPSIVQWMDYHRAYLGIDHFVLYDAGSLDDRFTAAFKPLLAQGLLTVTNFREVLKYDVMMQGQLIAQMDCLYRSREVAKWIMFQDFDEYLEVVPPLTFPALLRQHQGKAFITHGSYLFSVERCEEADIWHPASGKYAVELLLERTLEPFCELKDRDRQLCLGSDGHRKGIYNPRKTLQVRVHEVQRMLEQGVDMKVSEMRHAHYRGLQVAGRACKSPEAVKGTGFQEWIWPSYNVKETSRYTGVADIAAQARACVADFFQDKERCNLHLQI